MTTDGAPRWFSENPSKAWGEKFFLIYSPIWMTMMGLVMGLGVTARVGEWGFLAIGVAVALPLVAVPALIRDEKPIRRRWYQTYWFKANLYIAIFNFAANYFGTEYFFDILGMVYDYPMIELTLDATLVGSGEQRVPVIMYLLTQAYFITYHTTAVIVLRRIRTSRLPIGADALAPLALRRRLLLGLDGDQGDGKPVDREPVLLPGRGAHAGVRLALLLTVLHRELPDLLSSRRRAGRELEPDDHRRRRVYSKHDHAVPIGLYGSDIWTNLNALENMR